MLHLIDEKIVRTQSDIETLYPNCKYLLVDFKDDEDDISGYLLYISDSPDSYVEICNKRREINKNGGNSIVLGSYNKGGMVGVQYEVTQ